MNALKTTLYLQAGVWALSGIALAVAPGFVLVTWFDQPSFPDYAWLRLLGIEAFGLAMLMVLVAHRIRELWWWSWAFAFVSLAVAAVVVLNAALGLDEGQSAVLWWVFSAVSVAFSASLLYGLAVTARQNPLL